jgi:hypothetical protein
MRTAAAFLATTSSVVVLAALASCALAAVLAALASALAAVLAALAAALATVLPALAVVVLISRAVGRVGVGGRRRGGEDHGQCGAGEKFHRRLLLGPGPYE